MKTIYLVMYKVKRSGFSGWISESTRVLSNGDALEAVAKAKSYVLRGTGIDAFGIARKTTGFRLTAVMVIATADI